MEVINVLEKENIFTNLHFSTKEEVLNFLSQKLVKSNAVTEYFYESIIKREEEYPTGLSTNQVGVAIPHTDNKFVNKTTISLGVLEKPVIFKSMEDAADVEVRIIFILAIAEPKGHLDVLKQIVSIIQNDETINTILTMDKEKILEKINKY